MGNFKTYYNLGVSRVIPNNIYEEFVSNAHDFNLKYISHVLCIRLQPKIQKYVLCIRLP